ncbi:MAG: hypothetical protein C4584_02850 [Armatimonadetes bacterium]|nr:MAG: hypothetical protein C4584_02850 [Armatimonadota bacterium]
MDLAEFVARINKALVLYEFKAKPGSDREIFGTGFWVDYKVEMRSDGRAVNLVFQFTLPSVGPKELESLQLFFRHPDKWPKDEPHWSRRLDRRGRAVFRDVDPNDVFVVELRRFVKR